MLPLVDILLTATVAHVLLELAEVEFVTLFKEVNVNEVNHVDSCTVQMVLMQEQAMAALHPILQNLVVEPVTLSKEANALVEIAVGSLMTDLPLQLMVEVEADVVFAMHSNVGNANVVILANFLMRWMVQGILLDISPLN